MLRVVLSRLPVGWAGRLALQRLLSQWRSLLTVVAGILLSASVGALIPLYTAAVAQVSMVERLNQLPSQDIHAAASLALIPSQTPQNVPEVIGTYDTQFRGITERLIGQPFTGWLNRVVFYGETGALAVDPPAVTADPGGEARIPDPTTRVYVAYYQDWPGAVSLLSGRLPNDSPADDGADGADIEIAVPFEAQNALNVIVGDVLILDQGGPRGGWPTSKNVRARVVGIVNPPEQLNSLQAAYFMPPSPLRLSNTSGEYSAEYAALTTQAAFERVVTQFVPDTPTRFGWRLIFDHTRLPFSRSPEARSALLAYQNQLLNVFRDNQPTDLQFSYHTRLIDWQTQNGENADRGILIDYERSVRSLDAPFGLLLLQVGGLVIFFLMVTAALVRRGERREIAMLQSRGAADRSLILIRSVEALLICLAAALLAPVLSQQVLITITPFFARYPNLPLLLTPTVFAYAAAAALAAFVALMLTLRPVLRLPLISSGGLALRSEGQPWWQRYYVDVILAVLGVAALLRLVGNDTPLFTTTAGGSATDPFLLLAPAFLFLGMGSVLLRLFPAIASAAARVLAARRGLVGPMAAWQLSREPLHYGRITFLLALAIGIGWFATSFRATVDRSQNDQAQYRVGTDARFVERDMRLNASRARDLTAYTALPGVQAATITWRRPYVNFQSDPGKPGVLGTLLAVDSATFKAATYWRSDLGTVSTPGGAGSLPERGQALPFVPQKLGLWARFDVRGAFGAMVPDLDRLRNRTTLYARLLDSTGAWLNLPFKVIEVEYTGTGPQSPGLSGGGAFITDGWAYLETDLSVLAYRPVEPLRLVSLYWQHRGRGQGGERFLSLTLAGLNATDAQGARRPLDLFNAPGWEFAYDSGAFSQGSVSPGFGGGKSGAALVAQWDQTAESARVGLLLNYPLIDPPALIASESLAAQLGLQPGQKLNLRNLEQLNLSFTVIGAPQRFYPTVYDAFRRDAAWTSEGDYRAFAITDRDSLLYLLNRRPGAALYPDEVWLKAASGTDPDALLAAVRPADRRATLITAQTLPGELAKLQTDPLSRGLLGLMLLAFIVAMTLSVVGLLTYAALTATARRAEFGVLRALGLSAFRVIIQLALEQLFVIGLGVALGVVLGIVLSSQVVPRLAQNASGVQITPPFIVQVETAALTQYSLVILGVIGLVLLFSLFIVRQLSVSRTLRLGEE